MFAISKLAPIIYCLLRNVSRKNTIILNNFGLKLYFWLLFYLTFILGISVSAAPAISSIIPNNGPTAGGTNITINGTGFENVSEIWAKQTTGSLNQISYDTATDSSGNVYITGSFGSTISFDGVTTLTTTGSSDTWLAKYNLAGNFLWARRSGGITADLGHGVATDSAGNVYVAGSFSGIATFGALTPVVSTGGNDAFLVKYNSAGTEQWVKTGGSSGADQANSVVTDVSGNVFITGKSAKATTFGSFSLPDHGNDDVFVVKYSSAGVEQWFYQPTGNSNDSGNGIAVDNGGNILITGYYGNTLVVGSTTLARGGGGSDTFVLKLSTSGVPTWARRGVSPNSDSGNAIAIDVQNNVYISGRFSNSISFGSFSLTSLGNNDIFVAGYNPNGTEIWAKSGSGAGSDIGNGLATDNFSNLYATGQYSSASLSFGAIALTGIASIYSYLVKYSLTPTIKIGTTDCLNVNFVSVAQISCTTPAGTVGPKNVIVTNPSGSTSTATAGFVYGEKLGFNIQNSSDTAGTNSCDLGQATTSNLSSCSYRLKVSSNATNSYSISMQTSGSLSNGSRSISNAAVGATGTGGNNISPSTIGTEKYGISINPGAITGTGTISTTSLFNAGTTNSVNSNYSTPQVIIQATGINTPNSIDTTNTALITHKLNISSDTSAGRYTQTVTYTLIPNF